MCRPPIDFGVGPTERAGATLDIFHQPEGEAALSPAGVLAERALCANARHFPV